MSRTTAAALLLLVVAVASYTRLTNWAGAFGPGGDVRFGGLDSYYHVRRVELTVRHYPRVPMFDAWANHPEGARLDWPIGFDLALATVCKLAMWLAPSPTTLHAIAALFDPLLGVLGCLAIFALARRLGRAGAFGDGLRPHAGAAGVIAALLAALLPILSGYAIVGRVDHHAAEPLLLVLPLLALTRALDPDEQHPRRWSAVAGVELALGVAVWPGSIVAAGLIAGGLALAQLSARGERAAKLARHGRLLCLAAGVTMVPLSLLHPWARDGSFAYYAPSWLQPALFATAAAAFTASGVAAFHHRAVRVAVWVLLPAALLGVLAAGSTALQQTIADAWGYLARGEAQISQVSESRPLLADGLDRAVEQYSPLIVLTPLLFVLPLYRLRRLRAEQRPPLQIATVCLWGGGVLGLSQVRLGSLFAPQWCAFAGLEIVAVYLAARARWPQRRRWQLCTGLGAVLLVGLSPTLALHRPVRIPASAELLSTLDGLRWLADSAADPGDSERPRQRPRFAVMSRWQYGHWLTYFAGHANVANPLGQTETNRRGVRDAVRFFLAPTLRVGERILERRDARYALFTPLLGELELVTRHLPGYPLHRYQQRGPGGRIAVQPAYLATLQSRLYRFDGRRVSIAGRRYAPARHFRLVYECRRQVRLLGRRLAACKLFEHVRGARLVGSAPPGERIDLALRLETNLGRRMLYRDSTVADERGRYARVVPYATGTTPHSAVRAASSYAVYAAGRLLRPVAVSDEAVLHGLTIR